MNDAIARLGAGTLTFLATLGRSGHLLIRSLLLIPGWRDLARISLQIFSVGVKSLVIIVVAGFFIGMVLGLQGYTNLVRFGAEAALGPFVALSLVRELGPVVSALLFAGRAGSSLTAEIGLMKATEQLAGMELMAVDPLRRIVTPRFWAGFISMPLLAAIFTAVGIIGAYLVGVSWLGVDGGSFWSGMQDSVDFQKDILNGVVKSLVFGFVVTWIAVFRGYDTLPTSEGISRSTTQTVVHSSLAVLGLDFILTALMFGELN